MKCNTFGRWLCIVGLMIVISSCGTSRKSRSLAGISFETVSARFRMTIPLENEKIKLKGILKIKDGEIIQASVLVPMIRSEAARIEITTDSILVIDRMNKLYATGPLSVLDDLFGTEIDYTLLQSIFTNDISGIRQNKMLKHIKMELSNVVLNKTDPKPTTVSSRYTQIGPEEMIRVLDQMQ